VPMPFFPALEEALSLIFSSADTAGFEEDARLTAMWLWTLKTVDVGGTNGSVEETEEDDDDEVGKKNKVMGGFALEYDAARKIAQGLGANLENLHHLVLLKGETAILLPVSARTKYLFGKDSAEAPKGVKKKKREPTLFDVDEEILEQETDAWEGELKGQAGKTILDQLHQSMILFAANRSEALKRFLVEDGIGGNPLYWKLAQALSALYPTGTDEKRWVDGVLAKKKGFGF
jgi:putative DNA methylase